MTDRELLDRARAGDRAAFQAIVEAHGGQLYYLALGMTRDTHEAEDVVQEAFLKAYRSLEGFRGEARIGTWLYRVTVNLCLDRRRRSRFSTLRGMSSLDAHEVAEPAERRLPFDPERQAEAGRIRADVDRAVERLTPLERSVFVLRHYNDLSIREIAGVLERAEGTVKNVLFRAVRKLRRELAAYGGELGIEKTP